MYILGKSSPIEISLANMQNAIDKLQIKTTLSQELHPLQNCFSVNLSFDSASQLIYSNGKGETKESCLASAYGEFIERVQTNNFFSDFYLPNRKHFQDEVVFDFDETYLCDELMKIYNPNRELIDEDFVDFNSDFEDKIVGLPFQKLSSNETVFIPQNLISNLYVSNGLASGNTPKEAQTQALSEIIERYVKIKIIKEGLSLPDYPANIISKFDKLSQDKKTLEKNGYKINILDASLGGIYPVTAISLINPKNNTIFVSFGSHPILEVSLCRTMTELMQGRDLSKLDSFETPTFDMTQVDDSSNIESHFVDSNGRIGFAFLNKNKSFQFTSWNFDGKNTDDEFDFLKNIIKKEKKEIYLREYFELGFYSCQMIVPNFSEVYDFEDLIYNNKNTAKQIRKMVLNFKDYKPNDILDAIISLDNSIDVGRYIGVIFKYPFTMLEFKAQMYILCDEPNEAKELLLFDETTNSKKLSKVITQLIILDDENLNFDDFKDGLYSIFGETYVTKGLNIIAKKEYLIDTTISKEYENILAFYDRFKTFDTK